MTFSSATTLTLFYDGIIATVLAAVPLYFAVSMAIRSRGESANKNVATGKVDRRGAGGFGVLLAAVWLVVVYGSFIEPRRLVVTSADLAIGHAVADAPAEPCILTVALISDTHLGQYRHEDWLRTVVRRINELQPDVVLIAGDVVSTPGGLGSLKPLRELKTKHGAYAVLGNWDYVAGAVDVRRAIESQGVEVLTNESVVVEGVRIAGLDDVTYGKPDVALAFATNADGTEAPGDEPPMPRILLTHNPDGVSEAEVVGTNLVLAGHTHGGQVRLPFIGAVPHLPISIGQRYDEGAFDVGAVRLFITSGVGESGARARLFNPPEISLLRISY